MKSDMPVYKDDVDASVQKVRAVLQERGMLDGFTSSLKDGKTAAASEEIVNAISLHLEQYLAGNASEAIDQVSGRIQAKLDDLGESGVSVSDEAIEKIRSELQSISGRDEGRDDDSISQKIVEVLNSIGPKIKDFKDFIEKCYNEGTAEKSAENVVEKTAEPRKYAEKKTVGFLDKKFFVSFIDEVMPDMSFFDDSLQRLQDQLGKQHFALWPDEGPAPSKQPSNIAVISLMSAVAEIEQAVAAVAAIQPAQPEQASGNVAGAVSSSVSQMEQISAKVVDITDSVSSAADAIWKATVFAYAFTALLIMSAASIVAIAPQIALVVALLLAAVVVSAVAAAVVAIVLSAALAVMTILFSASGIIAAPIMAAASAVSTAVTSMVTTVFSMSLSVASALVSAAGTIIITAVQAVGTMLAQAAFISANIFAAATGLLLQAVSVTIGIIGGALSAAAGISLAVLSGAVSIIIAVLAASIVIGAAATALAAIILAGALAVVFAASVIVSVAGILLLAASIVAGAIALVLAGTAVAITLGVAVIAASMILAAGLAFSLVLAVALALIAVVVAATALAISLAIAAFTVGLTLLLILVVAVPLAIVWGIWWVFDQIKKHMGVVDDTAEKVDGWMDFFRKNEDGTPKTELLTWLGQTIVGLVQGIASWVQDWGVWKWLGKAWDWISNWAKKLGYAIESYVTECKNGFIGWWNDFIDRLVDCGKFSFFGKDVDLFSGAESMKIDLASGPNPPQYKVMEDDKAFMTDDTPAVIEDIKRERDEGLNGKVKQYKEQVDAKIQEDNKKQVEDVKASGAEVDAELDAFLAEASKKPDVKTPPVPVQAPGARKSLEEQEN